MQLGLRASEANRIQELCIGDKRLLMRIGALLQDRLCFSEAVLEEITRSPDIRNLIMDRKLGKDLDDSNLNTIIEAHNCADMGLMISRDEKDEGNIDNTDNTKLWSCIHLDDELNNVFSQSEEAEPEQHEPDNGHQWMRSVSDLLPSLSSAVRTPLEGLLAAQGDDQRAAAIEQLRYAAPSLAVVSEIMPVILSDGADIVRERGIGLLINAGASPVVTDIIRALQRGDDKTLTTLSEHVDRLPLDQQELIFAALIANATRGTLTQAMIQLSAQMAELISSHRGLHRYIELITLHGEQLSLVGFIRQIQKYNADELGNILQEFLDQGKESDARIIVLLAHPDAILSTDIIERGVHLLLSHDEKPKERMGLANALRRMQQGQQLATCIAHNAQHLEPTRDSTIYWLLAELSREQKISTEDANTISVRIRSILKRASGPHVVPILDQQLPAILPCDSQHKTNMVEPIAELLARFLDDRSQGHILLCLEKMGESAIEPLWKILANHPTSSVRCSCARIMPHLCAHYTDDKKRTVIEKLLQESENNTHQSSHADTGAFYLASAQMLLSLSDTQPSNEQTAATQKLAQEIDQRAEHIGIEGIDALACFASSQHLDPSRRMNIVEMLIDLICANLPDGQSEEVLDPATQDVTFILDDTISVHTEIVPRALNGLLHIASSTHCPPQLLRRITMTLMNQWRKVSRWEIMWGPGNIYHLAKTLSDLASLSSFPEPLRLQVAESLGPRCSQLRIAEYLLQIISASPLGNSVQPTRMHAIAHKSIKRILHDINKGQYADDEFSDLCSILAQFLCLPAIYDDHDKQSLAMQVAHSISLLQSHCSMRCKELLAHTFEKFNNNIREQLSWLNT